MMAVAYSGFGEHERMPWFERSDAQRNEVKVTQHRTGATAVCSRFVAFAPNVAQPTARATLPLKPLQETRAAAPSFNQSGLARGTSRERESPREQARADLSGGVDKREACEPDSSRI